MTPISWIFKSNLLGSVQCMAVFCMIVLTSNIQQTDSETINVGVFIDVRTFMGI